MGPRALASVPPVYLSVPNCPYDLDNLPATFQGPYGTGLEPYGMGESPRTQQDKDPPPPAWALSCSEQSGPLEHFSARPSLLSAPSTTLKGKEGVRPAARPTPACPFHSADLRRKDFLVPCPPQLLKPPPEALVDEPCGDAQLLSSSLPRAAPPSSCCQFCPVSCVFALVPACV